MRTLVPMLLAGIVLLAAIAAALTVVAGAGFAGTAPAPALPA
jgi:hypothetical protein